MPQALYAFEVEDASNPLEPHQDAEINFLLERPGAQSVFFDGNLVLYGKESRPSTILLLKPGDTVRIVGTSPVTLVPVGVAYESLGNSVSDRYLGKATMYAYFGIHEAELRRTHRKECDG